MDIKRYVSGLILFPIFAVVMVFGNKYVIDIAISIIAIMCLHEFYKAFRGKAKPISWVRIYSSSGNCHYTHDTFKLNTTNCCSDYSCFDYDIICKKYLKRNETKHYGYCHHIFWHMLHCFILAICTNY